MHKIKQTGLAPVCFYEFAIVCIASDDLVINQTQGQEQCSWIPAFAGMTMKKAERKPSIPSFPVIPAKAGRRRESMNVALGLVSD